VLVFPTITIPFWCPLRLSTPSSTHQKYTTQTLRVFYIIFGWRSRGS
jgi:hypothetical protein